MPQTMTVIMQGEGFLIVTAGFAALNAHAGVVYAGPSVDRNR